MSKKTKIKAKIPQIMNKNKNLGAVISKLRTESDEPTEKKKVQPGNLPTISESIKDKILNNETIVKLFPDIELSIQIMTSSILAPNDMGATNLIYNAEDVDLPSEIKVGLLDTIKSYISTNYKLEDKLPTIVREAMFTKGAYVEAVIPEASLDAMINNEENKGVKESLEEFVDKNYTSKEAGILGKADTAESFSFEDMTLSLEERDTDDKEKKVEALTVSDEDLLLNITDNYALLGAVSKKAEQVLNVVSNEMYSNDISMEELDEFDKLFKPIPKVKDADVVTVLTKDEVGVDSIGKPLTIKLPVEAVVPVHVTGDVTKHLGYFILLDEKGVPVNSDSHWDINSDDMSKELSKRAKSIIDKADNAINGFSKKDPTLDNMEEIYSHIVHAKIKKRIADGIMGDLASIDEDNSDVYRVMWQRVLKKQKTKLLFVPSELVTYYAFKFRENGTGESLLENITVLSSIRAILLFARIMANIKNSVTTTEVNATLDDADPDPSKTMDKIISETMKGRQTQLPIGVTRVEDLVDWTKKVGYKFNFKHEDLPDMDISSSENQSSKVVPDSDLDEEIRKQILMAFSLPPKAVEDGYDSDFATTIVQSNILFTKRVITYQDALLPTISEHVKRILKNDMKIYNAISDNIADNIKIIVKYVEKAKARDNVKITNINETNLIKWLTDKYIESIDITLPRIEEHQDDNMKEAFDNYKDSLDEVIELFFGDEAVPEELAGIFGETTDEIQYAIKSALLRKWMADNNYMPEILKATSANNEGKPVLDVFSEFTNYVEDLEKIILPFIKENEKKKAKRDEAVDKAKGEGDDDDLDNKDDDNTGGPEDTNTDDLDENLGDDPENTDNDAELDDDGNPIEKEEPIEDENLGDGGEPLIEDEDKDTGDDNTDPVDTPEFK